MYGTVVLGPQRLGRISAVDRRLLAIHSPSVDKIHDLDLRGKQIRYEGFNKQNFLSSEVT